MKTTKRFEDAVSKLYTAFHSNKLEAQDCGACAVGNMLGHGNWSSNYYDRDIEFWNNKPILKIETRKVVWLNKNNDYKRLKREEIPTYAKNNSGYTLDELAMVEKIFLDVHENSEIGSQDVGVFCMEQNERLEIVKQVQFDALTEVVKYLASLDNIPNPMDYSKAFERTNDEPVYELETIF